MKLLLDTHVFLWSLLDTAKLRAAARAALSGPANEVFVSTVTFWEIAINFGLGKADLDGIRPDDLPSEARAAGYRITPLDADDATSSHRSDAGFPRSRHVGL